MIDNVQFFLLLNRRGKLKVTNANVLNDGTTLGGTVATVGILATVRLNLRVNSPVSLQVRVALKRLATAVKVADKFNMLRFGVLVDEITNGRHKVTVLTAALEDTFFVKLKFMRYKGKVAVEFDGTDGTSVVAVTFANVRPKVFPVEAQWKKISFVRNWVTPEHLPNVKLSSTSDHSAMVRQGLIVLKKEMLIQLGSIFQHCMTVRVPALEANGFNLVIIRHILAVFFFLAIRAILHLTRSIASIDAVGTVSFGLGSLSSLLSFKVIRLFVSQTDRSAFFIHLHLDH